MGDLLYSGLVPAKCLQETTLLWLQIKVQDGAICAAVCCSSPLMMAIQVVIGYKPTPELIWPRPILEFRQQCRLQHLDITGRGTNSYSSALHKEFDTGH